MPKKKVESISSNDDDDDIVEVKRQKIEESIKGASKRSPLRLTRVTSLPDSENHNTVTLGDLIGHEDLIEMYQFNYMISLSYVMGHVNPKVRSKIKAHFVFGRRPKDAPLESLMEEERQSLSYPDTVTLEPIVLKSDFATHHTKLMVLIFHDKASNTKQAQVVIHTANLIPFDWGDMTQGVWKSPRLRAKEGKNEEPEFKTDFIDYIKAYRKPKLTELAKFLSSIDFGPVKGVEFIGSVPGNYYPGKPNYRKWGVLKLHRHIEQLEKSLKDSPGDIIMQVSSIATLGPPSSYFEPILLAALRGEEIHGKKSNAKTTARILFPTVDNIQQSLNGYDSGSSIHFNSETPKQASLLNELKPMLCKWKGIKSGRDRAAPHIKTYTRTITEENGQTKLGWIVLTSANMSKQAWGIVAKAKKNLWVQSWEAGVLIHPQEDEELIPCYKSDTSGKDGNIQNIRMPFDLPPTIYSSSDTIWSPHRSYSQPDWRGGNWSDQ